MGRITYNFGLTMGGYQFGTRTVVGGSNSLQIDSSPILIDGNAIIFS